MSTDEFNVGVVVTSGPGRRENVEKCLSYLNASTEQPQLTVLVLDGHDEQPRISSRNLRVAQLPKHEPGGEQPRNAGLRIARSLAPDLTHVWFLDSDIIVSPSALGEFCVAHALAAEFGHDPILIGPYEWLSEGVRRLAPEVRSDYRWEMFNERGHRIEIGELGVALGCFGGNLVWPIDEFIRIGGFHPLLHHGRCEDGELGLRAASHRIPMMLVPEARGYHLAHEVNLPLILERNRRDVPLINQWHPWVEEQGLIVTDADGARFDFRCTCGEQINTLLMWDHLAGHA